MALNEQLVKEIQEIVNKELSVIFQDVYGEIDKKEPSQEIKTKPGNKR